MPAATAPTISLTPRQRAVLKHVLRSGTTPQQVVRRSRVILGAADGTSTEALARAEGSTRRLVQRWRARWHAAQDALLATEALGEDGVAPDLEAVIWGVLADDPRSGAPPTFTPEALCQIMAIACEPPADSDRPISQWTPRELADEAVKRQIVPRISARTVGRFLVLGEGRDQTAPEPVLAQPPGTRPGGLHPAGGDDLHRLCGGAGHPRAGRPHDQHR